MKKLIPILICLLLLVLVGQIAYTPEPDYQLFGHIDEDLSISLPKHLHADTTNSKALYKEEQSIYLSELKHADFDFTGLGVSWTQFMPKGTSVKLEARFLEDKKWTNWTELDIEQDADPQSHQKQESPASTFISTNKTNTFQYKYTLNTDDKALSPEVKDIHFTYINANDDPMRKNKIEVLSSVVKEPGALVASAYFGNKGLNYISRGRWGANEDLRLYNGDNPEPKLVNLPSDFYIRYAEELKLQKIVTEYFGDKLTWPLQYPTTMSKIVIHHTATTKDLEDPKKAVRDIYYFHAISKGWGDIGYNYIIDQDGNIYEGRYGGEAVVGAHAGPGNRGSIGIALLGNFNESEISDKSLLALETLISEKTKQYKIDPLGSDYFRGWKLNNIMGHSDIMATSCPGTNIKTLMPKIRNDIDKINGNYSYSNEKKQQNVPYAYDYLPNLEIIKMPPDRKMEYTAVLKNLGTKAWKRGDVRLKIQSDPLIKNSFHLASSDMQELVVNPGETASFKIKLMSKLSPGFFYLTFAPSFGEISLETFSIPVIVDKPVFNYELLDISIPKSMLQFGEKTTALVTLRNSGNISWKNYGTNRISLGTDNPQDRVSAFTQSTRMGYLKENIVRPGATGHFVFNLKAPGWTGEYEEYFSPVIEDVTWLDGQGMKMIMQVKPKNLLSYK